ncbi:hypothetical protein ACL58G_31240 [Massilia sp. GER05]
MKKALLVLLLSVGLASAALAEPTSKKFVFGNSDIVSVKSAYTARPTN